MLKYILELCAYLGIEGYLISQVIMEGIAKSYSIGAIVVECIGVGFIITLLSLIAFAVFEFDCGGDLKPSDMVPKYSPYGRFLSRMESLDKKENTK